MAKLEPSGVLVKPPPVPGSAHGGAHVKVRRFPWRLWLWALVMTAAAGAGGYFTWHFKSKADDAVASDLETQRKFGDKEKALATTQNSLDTKTKEAADCVAKKDEIEKASKSLADQLKTNKDQLTELAKVVEQNKVQLDAAKNFQEQFSKMIDSGAIKVSNRHGNIVLSLPAEVLFPSGIADLSDDGKIKVHEIGFTLKDKGPKNARYLVVGHSDNQPLKNSAFRDNWALSQSRALSVVDELVKAGMDAKRLLPAGAGEHDPVAPNTSVKDLARNRRIEIVLLPAISELPEPDKKVDKKDEKKDEKKK